MATTVSAGFVSVDMADLARARLREHGVEYADMKIEETGETAVHAGYDNTGAMINAWVPLFSNGLNGFGGVAANVFPFGGIIPKWDGDSFMDSRMSRDVGLDGSETPQRTPSVRMTLTVRSDQARQCEAILTSCHATNLRRG